MKTVAIIAARMNSTRFKGKVLMELDGERVLWHVYRAAHQAIGIDNVVVATTVEAIDDEIVAFCNKEEIPYWRGSEENVLERFYDAARHYLADAVVRLTGDCPLLDSYVVAQTVALFKSEHRHGVHYANNTEPATYPDGLDCEVVSMEALEAAHRKATLPSDRDTVCQWISRHQIRFPAATLINPLYEMENERWVLDTAEDYQFCKEIFMRLCGVRPSLPQILDILDKEPELRNINAKWKRNERYLAAVAKEAGA